MRLYQQFGFASRARGVEGDTIHSALISSDDEVGLTETYWFFAFENYLIKQPTFWRVASSSIAKRNFAAQEKSLRNYYQQIIISSFISHDDDVFAFIGRVHKTLWMAFSLVCWYDNCSHCTINEGIMLKYFGNFIWLRAVESVTSKFVKYHFKLLIQMLKLLRHPHDELCLWFH